MIVKELFAKLGLEVDDVGFERGEAAIHALHHGFMAFGTAAAGALAVGAAFLAKFTADSAVAAKKLSDQTGVNLEDVQKFGFAAEASGASAETMARALGHLAKTGVKDVKAEVLKIAEHMHGMPNDGRRVAYAMEKFGKGAKELLPMLARGKEYLEEMGEEAEDLGLIFTEEDVAQGREFKKALHEIEGAFKGMGFAIGRLVLPFFTKLLQGITHLLHDLRHGAKWVQNLTLALKVAAFTLGGVLLAALVANIGAIATTVSWYAALGIASVVAGVKAAAAWVAATWPVLALIAGFTLLLLILDDIRGYFNDEDSLIGEIGPKWTAFLDDMLKVNATDPWWLVALKEAGKFITDIQGGLEHLEAKFKGASPWVKALINPVGTVMDATGIADRFGGGASPAASTHVSSPWAPEWQAGTRTPVAGLSAGAPMINAPIHISGIGMSSEQVAQTVGDHVQRVIQQTAAETE